MLVLRKEIKIGIGAGLTILGIAAVYGLIAALSSSGTDANKQVASAGGGSAAAAITDRGNGGGLPPAAEPETPAAKPEAGRDPFAETVRTDGNTTTDPWANAFAPNGGIGKAPITLKSPTEPKRDNRVIVDPLPGREADVARAMQNGGVKIKSPTPNDTTAAKTSGNTGSTGGTKYVIKSGDTFSTIAKAQYGSKAAAAALLKANPDVDPKRLRPGKEINLPPKDEIATIGGSGSVGRAAVEITAPIDASRQYRVAAGDTLSRISTKVYRTSNKWEELYEANKATIGSDPARLKVGTLIDLPEKPVR